MSFQRRYSLITPTPLHMSYDFDAGPICILLGLVVLSVLYGLFSSAIMSLQTLSRLKLTTDFVNRHMGVLRLELLRKCRGQLAGLCSGRIGIVVCSYLVYAVGVRSEATKHSITRPLTPYMQDNLIPYIDTVASMLVHSAALGNLRPMRAQLPSSAQR